MRDDTPDWRDDRTGDEGGYERPRQSEDAERRSRDPRFTDTRPPSYADDAGAGPRETGRSAPPRERLSADYDEEPVFRRRAGGSAGGLSALLGSDALTRRLVYGAAGLGALLVIGVGGWSLLGGHSGGIPVIGPPPGPVRDRPADPGGMQIMGDGTDLDVTGQGEAHLAPEPEQPRPEALAARAAPETPAAPTAKDAVGNAPASPADGPASSDGVAPAQNAPAAPAETGSAPGATRESAPRKAPETTSVSSPDASPEARPAPKHEVASGTPATSPAVSPPASSAVPAAEAPASAKQASGGHMVQLAALGSEADAKATWGKLSKQATDLLADRTPMIEQKTINGHVFFRLRVGGFDTAQAARAFCVRLHARSIACTPAVF
ncbi:SPOR domain-containing protein [Asaia sp. VD9]|uniref:SPOR domain-containing protein n=1 Tax=Asaia sp. VD9 TaxID=3081235 RepID=UPI0030168217